LKQKERALLMLAAAGFQTCSIPTKLVKPTGKVIILAAEHTNQFAPHPVVNPLWLECLPGTEESLSDFGFLFQQAPAIMLYSVDRSPETSLWKQQTEQLI
jgi:hypothetical protein